jgi:hypothetical protein
MTERLRVNVAVSPGTCIAPETIPPAIRAWLQAISRCGAGQREIITVV